MGQLARRGHDLGNSFGQRLELGRELAPKPIRNRPSQCIDIELEGYDIL
jgi:hypothetical protein